MPRPTRRTALAVAAVLAFAAPALALYPKLSTALTGPAGNGATPSGSASVDQPKLPNIPGTLAVEVRSVGLPDGTTLTVAVDGDVVGTLRLSRGQGRLSTTIPMQVGRNARLTVSAGGTVILSNPVAWKT